MTKTVETKYHHYICLECGEVYFSTDPQVTLYCSKECETRARKKGEYMGAESHVPNPYDLDKLETRLCATCGERFITRTDSIAETCMCCNGKESGTRVFRAGVCRVCGAPFTPTNGHQKYCSPECAAAKEYLRHSSLSMPVPCKICGKLFVRSSGNQQCCSPECKLENRNLKARKNYKEKKHGT